MSSFLLYKADPRVPLEDHAQDLSDALRHLHDYDFDAEEVYQQHVRPSGVMPIGRLVSHAQQSLGVPEAWGVPELVSCRWAGPHVDEEWRGNAFVSVVLHTGPYPYQVSAFSTEKRPDTAAGIDRAGRLVEVGDVFVFDPTQAHCAFPLCPDRKSLLVLLQWTVLASTSEALAQLRRVMPPAKFDADQFRFSDL